MMHWIFAHLIGDFILQNDWMELNKKKKALPLTVHTILYTLPFYFTGLTTWQILLIGVQHMIQDGSGFVVWFMKIKGSEDFTKSPCAPWSIFVIDNIIHICFIALVVHAAKFI